ncbi:hypothetical protein CCMA1212_004467 [Trichoderma ghanense]|uniref:Uncharacterized protein n=1 Tax=Trichoderma ghanense TaxID=65468 RepID=A0ABY2H4X7_9HYPO
MPLRNATADAAAWLGRCEATIGLDDPVPCSPGPESCVPLTPTQQMATAGDGTGGQQACLYDMAMVDEGAHGEA